MDVRTYQMLRCGVGAAFRPVGMYVYRLTTRGLLRFRRGGLGRSRISARVAARAFASLQGGKRRLAGDLAADDTKRSHERQAIRVFAGLVCRFAHEVPDRIVREQESPYLLPDHFR